MKRDWDGAELSRWWSLSFDELELIETKPPRTRLGFAAQLKMYRLAGRFAEHVGEVAAEPVAYLAEQLAAAPSDLEEYDWAGRTGRRHREEILAFLAIRRMTEDDRNDLATWLEAEICPKAMSVAAMVDEVCLWCRDRDIQTPAIGEVDRFTRSARRTFEGGFLQRIASVLSSDAAAKLEVSLTDADSPTGFNTMKADPGRVGLESIFVVAERLSFIRSLQLQAGLIAGAGAATVERLYRRVSQETAREVRRHPQPRRLGLYAIFLACREAEIVDAVVDLLVETVHKMAAKAERKVVASIAKDIQKVQGKERLLARIAEAAIDAPDGAVREVIFPIADQAILAALVREYKAGGSYQQRVHAVLRSSYGGHYRRMLPKLLSLLEFRSNNAAHRPVIAALEWLKRLLDEGDDRRIVRPQNGLPIEGVVPARWRDLVVESDDAGGWRVNRINYEICVLTSLRERIRCKEIWVVGADRYRNPDEDLPQDFGERRADYYRDLGQIMDAQAFVARLKGEMTTGLRRLDAGLPGNRHVRLLWRGRNRISLSPLEPLPAQPNLDTVKAEIERRWPATGLLDVLKEAALRTGFLEQFRTSGDRVILDPDTLQRRLLLCLYGLGTNAGLKRVSSGTEGVTYAELLHVRRRFIQKEALKAATASVTNALLAVRDPLVWGEGTTSCASDSKKFGAWDQNLMAEWHVRYGGRGVMIYWHVARQATCIYSQLKRCSSSEVAAMIEGVLRHCTDAEIQSQYVDSHGQSEVAFAFCRLLGFELAPRLKAIARQKLYLPDAGMAQELQNLLPILTRAIDWKLIEQQYDEMIKYAAALQHRTADAESILRRFARTNIQHPTYKALAELGKAVKTIFLTRYLDSEAFRREINEGLNVVENWNSANGFIFFGKSGEVATNRLEDQEISVLALHLLQNCLVYVNTLMMQNVLTEPAWAARMAVEDYRGLTPLIYAHINPYGAFDLDLARRIDFDARSAA
ncbi:Tn3 family transposase [Rhizobium sp. YTU87027]|uniref:Tn3 family transposase n=1 Tax=Rhizobium TaxID=379 RepID=UPI003D69BBC9